MRVAIDVQSTLGKKTGIGIYTARLVDALRRVAPQNEYMPVHWGADRLMQLHRRLQWQQIEVPRRARQLEAQLLHVPGFDAPLRRTMPTVVTVHDLIGMLFPKNQPPIGRFYWAAWLPFTVRFAPCIIADSEATRIDLQRLLKVPQSRIHVVPLGVDDWFKPQPMQAVALCRARYNLPEKFILYLGTLEPRKGIDTLVDAFAQISASESVDLVLAGKKGWYWDRVQQRIDFHRLGSRVHVVGYVADEDLPAIYSAAQCFVFASRYEGFGLPPLEAMSCGTPVITTNISSLPEVVGDAALLISPDQPDQLAHAMRRLLTEDSLADHFREAGIVQARQFSWDRCARETVQVYESLLEQPLGRK